MLWWNEGDQILAKFAVCPKNKVFHKPTAIKIATQANQQVIRGVDALDIVFSGVNTQEMGQVSSFICEIIDSMSHANTEKDHFAETMKFSGASVYKYAN